jgi:tetratricopeptide (TPR) repeat protein
VFDELHSDKINSEGRDSGGQAVKLEEDFEDSDASNMDSIPVTQNDLISQSRVGNAKTTGSNMESQVNTVAGQRSAKKRRPLSSRSWMLAAGLLLTILAIAASAVYLLTKKPSTVDQIIILTVPSGAEIELDSKPYGQSPVKLEQLAKGTYTLTITKDTYETIVQPITVSETYTYDFKLKLLPVPEFSDLPLEEQIKKLQAASQDAFDKGNYGLGYDRTALHFADLILDIDSTNPFAKDMRDRVQRIEHQAAQDAIASKDMAKAQDIYNLLVDHYPDDKDARIALSRLENQLLSRKGEVRDLVRKAEEALQAGNLIEPNRSSAYFYSKQALAIDRQNAQALAVRNQIKESLTARIEDAFKRGDADSAINQLEKVIPMFPEDKQLRARRVELAAARSSETARASDSNNRRVEGLDNYRHDKFSEAIPDLEFAITNGRGTTDVLFALARSYMMLGQHDKAYSYFRKIPPSDDDTYRSSIAALGDIAREHGDTSTALDRYKQARQLGGSALYPVAALDDKIERIEKKQREKAAEPIPITIRVKHIHGGFMGGSCSGTLMINSTGVRYDGTEHTFSSNLVAVGVRISKDEMTVRFQDKSEKFKVGHSESERFNEALSRFQQTYSPSNK